MGFRRPLYSPCSCKQGRQLDGSFLKWHLTSQQAFLVLRFTLSEINCSYSYACQSLSNAKKKNDPGRKFCKLWIVRRKPVMENVGRTHSHMDGNNAITCAKHGTNAGEADGLRLGNPVQQVARPRDGKYIWQVRVAILCAFPSDELPYRFASRLMKRESQFSDFPSQFACQPLGFLDVVRSASRRPLAYCA